MGKHKTKTECESLGLYDRPTLRVQRMKPGQKQLPAGEYWQGHRTVSVYALSECVPMRNYSMTPARAASLQKARDLVGTVLCDECRKRVDIDFYDAKRSMCFDCVAEKRLAARDLAPLAHMPTVFLDTETTGLKGGQGDEIVELCICDDDGKVIINTLVKPKRLTEWPEAQVIHGIAPDDVLEAPMLFDLMPTVLDAIRSKRVVIYNAQFDSDFFSPGTFDIAHSVECCMLRYARFAGDWNEYRNGWRWHKLSAAALHVQHRWSSSAHRAHADVLATKSVWEWMQSGDPTMVG